ncbi:MAG: FAD-dependent thymidylate synthase [Nanoarchaeota archaeon]
MGDDLISRLKHTSVNLSSGGEVIVLDTGAVIDCEAEAMLQALHSRSTGGLRSHLEVLAQKGADRFMEKFYVGYGHKSIGDCGTTTVFVEGVSILAAKAIQDSPLYSGQEASTRYIDFSNQPFIDPTRTPTGANLLESQRKIYFEAQEPTRTKLRKQFPRAEGEDEKDYEKAISARAFDITRSLLPSGASTNLAWHTNLRQAADRILLLRHHPLPEVREIAKCLEEALKSRHPNSFGHERYPETEAYQDVVSGGYLFHNPTSPIEPVVDFGKIDRGELERFRSLLNKRPKKTEIPRYVSQAGVLTAEFQLDFGSFRDIQRHRAINQRMPLVTADLGFNLWYLQNLPEEITARLPEHLRRIGEGIINLRIPKELAQYFLPMGYNVSNRFTGDIPASVYMIELRDTRFVHPTLQRVAHHIGNQIADTLEIPLHRDSEPGRFDIGRGKHDITLR